MQPVKNAFLYKSGLRFALKDATDLASLSAGRPLQTLGALTDRPGHLRFRSRVLGTTCGDLPEDPRLCLPL